MFVGVVVVVVGIEWFQGGLHRYKGSSLEGVSREKEEGGDGEDCRVGFVSGGSGDSGGGGVLLNVTYQ